MNNNTTYLEILASREDISNYMFHFTKKHYALDTLRKILSDDQIKDIRGTGYISFTEASIVMLEEMFKVFDRYYDPLYAPYGIGIERQYFIDKLNGRPVIWGDEDDKSKIHESLHWRIGDFTKKDFTWLREWRVKNGPINLEKDYCIVVIKDNENLESIKDIIYDGIGDIYPDVDIADGEAHTSFCGKEQLKYKCLSLEDIKKYNAMTKIELQKLINNVKLEETVNLGSC